MPRTSSDTEVFAAVFARLPERLIITAPETESLEPGVDVPMPTVPPVPVDAVKIVFGLLRKTETEGPPLFTVAISIFPSPFISPMATAKVSDAVPIVVSVFVPNVPLPLLRSRENVFVPAALLFAVKRSALPSPLMSPIATENGVTPVA